MAWSDYYYYFLKILSVEPPCVLCLLLDNHVTVTERKKGECSRRQDFLFHWHGRKHQKFGHQIWTENLHSIYEPAVNKSVSRYLERNGLQIKTRTWSELFWKCLVCKGRHLQRCEFSTSQTHATSKEIWAGCCVHWNACSATASWTSSSLLWVTQVSLHLET